jgi:hypothetical protein
VRQPILVEELSRTLHDLAAIGDKRAGSPGGLRAASYLRDRFTTLGLGPRYEVFHFPRHDVISSSLDVTIGGVARPMAHEVLEASGAGRLRGALVHAGSAESLDDRVAEKLALVERHAVFHRSAQYSNVAAAGARAMLTVSTAPGNLRQVGSVRRAWESCGAIPAMTIGAADGEVLKAALAAGQRVDAELEVAVAIHRGTGQNVVATIPGVRPEQIVVGAHYDSWFAGSTDNGAGVALLLALAARWARRAQPRWTLVFVAWDGEELALYGGYDYLRRHARERILAVVGLETPSAHGAQAYGLARSNQPLLGATVSAVQLDDLFALQVPMDLVAELFGGSIPTDIQGLYRAGTPSLATAVDSPYYHTVDDTPDKVDLRRLAELVDGFDRVLGRLMDEPRERFAERDPALWRAEVRARVQDGALLVDVTVRDHAGEPQLDAAVEATVFHDHFHETATRRAESDGAGRATLVFPAAALIDHAAPRFLHVTAGKRHPLVEMVLSLD